MEIETKLLQNMAGKLSVLFVEDNEPLRVETKQLLESLFQEVITAADGKEGYEKYLQYHKEHQANIDLVISDIMMPHMSGIDMAHQMVKLYKDQHFIFISAHRDSDYLINIINIGVSSFISKPITFDKLLIVLYKNCLELEGDSLQKGLLHRVIEENDRLKKEILLLKSKL